MIVLIEPHYLPSLEYFCALNGHRQILLEQHEYFVKQTYRNRCYLNTSQGVKRLSVPLQNRHGKIIFKDVKVEAGTTWRNNHWRTIESAYRSSPYFQFYADDLNDILFKNFSFLADLNHALLSFCLKNLKWQMTIEKTTSYQKNIVSAIDLRSQITDHTPFLSRNFYKPLPYVQTFGNVFVPNLSVIDLLFCEGPKSSEVLVPVHSQLNK
ncbi:MAG: hypothetical protein OJF59_001282 [Cytophagales bacterium]|jgi:hypothetical protein|nr:WbqC family protein [Bacteroidota bacterium]MBS1981905.1 WbqC family protein [Bacteroidota bacterium]WHZ07529.1 MAG: hypothetical protein OJF59_001282 [Cytophagales bacterium]